ncbi:hypothetical protein C1Y40_03727 [Mycobacterium talmoniae]|uniref:Uncharacterized protein n=1 Tax=Mycobacterium talmoniae TaxID=1858794 RepID=A0A2S8BHL3_9MYCO|nr:hypothetical protein C1Y40_03727 [Mycobacterium talmoniae]
MAIPRPISEITGWAKKFTGPKRVTARKMPVAPAMLKPPTITGRLAAITPPNTKNSTTATSGSARTSIRFWSVAMVPVSASATGCKPASLTVPPSSFCRAGWTSW